MSNGKWVEFYLTGYGFWRSSTTFIEKNWLWDARTIAGRLSTMHVKQLFYITSLTFLISCNSNQDFNVDESLTLMNHQKDAETDWLRIRDFSIAEGYAHLFDTIRLEETYCELLGDTLKFSIGYSSEGVNHPEFTIIDSQLYSETIMFSDVPEYNGEHIMKIPTSNYQLTLNKSKFVIGDTLIGEFNLTSDTIRFNNWNRPIYFGGKFQCIIEDPARHAQ